MTRVAKRAPKGPEAGGKFVSKPLLLKKSEIEKRKETSERRQNRVEEWPKRQRAETTQGMRSEQRRVNRLSEKEQRSTCYLCRKDGHRVKNCPQASNHDVGVCYHCGSEDHTTKSCPKPGKSFPYATCYVCKERGHLASKCKLNDKGLYPNGGGCKYCGSKLHLMRDCKPAQNNVAGTTVGMVVPSQGGDDDDVFTALRRQQEDKSKAASAQRRQASAPKVRKVVNF
ncbi:hypothetical protein GGI23_004228 [Coemansia sp. RSA 2559]|nr:hypothetical protein GGI23_004228 [Coemansia sp. RSA 2559]KAJ2856045.1 hypothetical protein GGI22_003932 [Coemansia erecta]